MASRSASDSAQTGSSHNHLRLVALSGTLKPIWIGRLGLHGNLSQRDLLAGLPSVALIMTVPAGSPGTSAKPTFVPFGTASAER